MFILILYEYQLNAIHYSNRLLRYKPFLFNHRVFAYTLNTFLIIHQHLYVCILLTINSNISNHYIQYYATKNASTVDYPGLNMISPVLPGSLGLYNEV